MTVGLRNPTRIPDDALLAWGKYGDGVSVLRSSTLGANTALENVLLGTPVAQAMAANFLLFSNIRSGSGVGLYVNNGGNSLEALLIDASLQSLQLGHAMTDVRLLATTVLGTGEGGVTAPVGNPFRAPDMVATA